MMLSMSCLLINIKSHKTRDALNLMNLFYGTVINFVKKKKNYTRFYLLKLIIQFASDSNKIVFVSPAKFSPVRVKLIRTKQLNR